MGVIKLNNPVLEAEAEIIDQFVAQAIEEVEVEVDSHDDGEADDQGIGRTEVDDFDSALAKFKSRKPSRQTIKVLRYFVSADKGEAYGYEISTQTGLKSGSLYVILKRLSEAKIVTGNWEGIESANGSRPRRVYTLTEKGKIAANDIIEEFLESSLDDIKKPKSK